MSTLLNSPAVPTPSALAAPGRRWLVYLCIALLLTLAVGLGGCAGERADAPVLTQEQFVDIIVALREAEREVAEEDSAAARFEERKRGILERHGTTEDQLRAFIVTHRDDLPVLQAVWDTITERLKYARPTPVGPEEEGAEGSTGTDEGEAAEPALLRQTLPRVPGADAH
jgi:hypothetical protein